MMIELKHAGHVHGICKDLYKGFAHYTTTSCRMNMCIYADNFTLANTSTDRGSQTSGATVIRSID
jgi:hypothetical protein